MNVAGQSFSAGRYDDHRPDGLRDSNLVSHHSAIGTREDRREERFSHPVSASFAQMRRSCKYGPAGRYTSGMWVVPWSVLLCR